MNKKNIIIFSVATTLLLANCLEGMEKGFENFCTIEKIGKTKTYHYSIYYSTKYKDNVLYLLKKLNNNEERWIEISICASSDITTEDLNILFDAMNNNDNTIEDLRLNRCKKIDYTKVNFHRIKNLKRLFLMEQDLMGVDILSAILQNNYKTLLHLNLKNTKNNVVTSKHTAKIMPSWEAMLKNEFKIGLENGGALTFDGKR